MPFLHNSDIQPYLNLMSYPLIFRGLPQVLADAVQHLQMLKKQTASFLELFQTDFHMRMQKLPVTIVLY